MQFLFMQQSSSVFLVCVDTPHLFHAFLCVDLDEEDKSALNNDPVAKVCCI